MKESKCYTCEKLTQNLLTTNCGHKICFNCVKNNRNTHKCAYCSLMSASKSKIAANFSPAKKEKSEKEKERTTKTKSIETKRYDQSSPFNDRSIKKNSFHLQSCSNYVESSTFEDPTKEIKLLCKEHQEPLTLFSKASKEAICSMCLCSRPKYNQEIMPIKGAESFLKRENQIQREESRVILNDIEKCYKVMKKNYEQFELFYGSHVKVIGEVFSQLHKELEEKEREIRTNIDDFFVKKLRQCQEIEQDLSYLIETLETYREENKESNSLTESIYVYSSFKVIKKTMKTLNLDYVSYANKNVNLLEYNKYPYSSALKTLIKFNEDLPIKHEEVISITKRRNRSASSNQKASIKKEPSGYSNKKKGSIAYENVLNEKMSLESEVYHQPFKRNEESEKKHPPPNSSFEKLLKPHHTNSLHTYIHQNLEIESQKVGHSKSTYAYFNQGVNKGNKDNQNGSSIDAFNYELKTPTKHASNINWMGSSADEHVRFGKSEKQQTEFERVEHARSLRKNNEFNIFSTSSINEGLNMNEEEKSLYKRLLKSRFSKNIGQNNLLENRNQTEENRTEVLIEEIKTEKNERTGYEE